MRTPPPIPKIDIASLLVMPVEKGEYDTAIAGLENNTISSYALDYLLNVSFLESKNPTNWIKFFLMALNSIKQESFYEAIEKLILSQSTKNPPIAANTLAQILCRCDNRVIIDKIINISLSRNFTNCFIQALPIIKHLNPRVCANLTTAMVPMSAAKYNLELLSSLIENDRATSQEAMYTINPRELRKTKYLLSLGTEEKALFTQRMTEFLNGFGNVTYEGALLTFAAISAKKNYVVNPTILRISEFESYLETLKEAPRPVREKFILTGGHWITGEIQIDEPNNAKILFIDSLALGHNSEEKKQEMFAATQDAIKDFASLFPGQTIYFPDEIKQRTVMGCSIFAIDDARHLFTVEKYLPPKYINKKTKEETGLFAYLEDYAKRLIEEKKSDITIEDDPEKKIHITRTRLPLPLMRTTQSSTLFLKYIPDRHEDELKIPVNKAGKTITESAAMHFSATTDTEKKHNRRLVYKLDKLAKDNADFLIANPEEEILQQKMQVFTLAALKKRIRSEKTPKPKPAT